MHLIPAFGRLKQANLCKFKTSLVTLQNKFQDSQGNTEIPYLGNKQTINVRKIAGFLSGLLSL